MVKPLGVLLFILLCFTPVFAADIVYDTKPDRLEFIINFSKGYSNLDILKSDKDIVFSFETSETLNFKREDFFDLPVASAYLISDSFRKKFILSFDGALIEPIVSKEDKRLTITVPFPPSFVAGQGTGVNENVPQVKTPALPGVGAYFRMIFGLGVVLMIVLVGYWFVKSYFKKQIFTDIPGSGRLLGKVDLDIRKSLFFYEIGDFIYIIGMTDSGMSLIDKVTDETEATKIRAGFSKKREFSGYMSFFKRKNELDDEISASNALVEEKLKSLRKK